MIFSRQNLIFLLIVRLCLVCSQSTTCRSRVVRKSIRELILPNGTLNSEGQAFIDGVHCLLKTPGIISNSVWEDFVTVHLTLSPANHGYAPFLPWHRWFLMSMETVMQNCMSNPNLYIPYWDSSLDSQSPSTSKIYNFFGGNGDQNGCIPNGAFQNLQSSVPTNHCVARNFDISVSLYPVELVSLLTSSVSGETTYNSFRENLEGTIHNSVHSFISGDMAQMISANDPLFYLHHSNIDRIWTEWQNNHPSVANTYGGLNFDGSQAVISYFLDLGPLNPVFGTKIVSDIINYKNLCYSYSFGSAATSPAATTPVLMKREEGEECREEDHTKEKKFTLKHPTPIPEHILRMGGLNVTSIRQKEKIYHDFTDYINTQDDILSNAALLYQEYEHYHSRSELEYKEHRKILSGACENFKKTFAKSFAQ